MVALQLPKDHRTVLMCACFLAETGMLLLAFKVAEFIGWLGAVFLVLTMAVVPVTCSLLEAAVEEAVVEQGKGRTSWTWWWWWPIFLWASCKISSAGSKCLCVPGHLGCPILF